MPTPLPAPGSTPHRRHELGAFLRNRRERLACADVGIPATGRRRTPGLRREEVAMLSGISTTWLTYLEQGRHVRASRQVLDALATTLQLTAAERAHVFDLASEAPPAPAVAALARLRAAAGRHPDDPRYTGLVRELRALSPQARSWWSRHDVRASTVGRKRVRHPQRGVLDLAYATFAVADHPEHTLVVYLDEGEGPHHRG